MKYRDVITFFIALAVLLTFGYTIGVDNNIWYIPLLLFIILIFMIYKLWIGNWYKHIFKLTFK